jgi:HD-GYP domain-containing protein (c-di-GMP phosphodiesterase class II)
MPDSTPVDSTHFTQAVVQLGESQPLTAAKAIVNSQGIKIVDKGAVINKGLYERLMRHQLASPLEDSVSSANAVDGPSLRQAAADTLSSVPFFGRMANDAKASTELLDAIENVPLPAPIAFQLTVARDTSNEMYLHAVRAALTTAWLARVHLASKFDVGIAAAAGLLHDIGMLHVDPLLLEPETQLSTEQRRQLYAHPLLSKALIERHHEYPKEVLRAVQEHHEYLDGSGYPRNLMGSTISPLGRMLGLAELVTAMFSPGREAPELRLSVILRMNLHRYDEALVHRVLRLIKPEQDVMSLGISIMEQPVQRLLDIDRLLADWPRELAQLPSVSAMRREGLTRLAVQVLQLHRALATVGATPEQLAQLGDDNMDDILLQELTLLAGEAAWQLRALALVTRRRWQLAPDEAYPPALLVWLTRVDRLATENAEILENAHVA